LVWRALLVDADQVSQQLVSQGQSGGVHGGGRLDALEHLVDLEHIIDVNHVNDVDHRSIHHHIPPTSATTPTTTIPATTTTTAAPVVDSGSDLPWALVFTDPSSLDPPQTGLPATGTRVGRPLAIASVLAAGGALLMLSERRSRR
jgi:hypothetical protein